MPELTNEALIAQLDAIAENLTWEHLHKLADTGSAVVKKIAEHAGIGEVHIATEFYDMTPGCWLQQVAEEYPEEELFRFVEEANSLLTAIE